MQGRNITPIQMEYSFIRKWSSAIKPTSERKVKSRIHNKKNSRIDSILTDSLLLLSFSVGRFSRAS
jgi:hypothetical protein